MKALILTLAMVSSTAAANNVNMTIQGGDYCAHLPATQIRENFDNDVSYDDQGNRLYWLFQQGTIGYDSPQTWKIGPHRIGFFAYGYGGSIKGTARVDDAGNVRSIRGEFTEIREVNTGVNAGTQCVASGKFHGRAVD